MIGLILLLVAVGAWLAFWKRSSARVPEVHLNFGEETSAFPENPNLQVPETETVAKKLTGPPPLITTKDGFVNFNFFCEREGRNLVIRGEKDSKPLGFALNLNDDWEAWTPENTSLTMFGGFISLFSKGESSDDLLLTLAQGYKVKSSMNTWPRVSIVEAIALFGDPRTPEKGLVKLKLFFGQEDAVGYSEVFLILDLPNSYARISEKDTDYRALVVKGFGSAQNLETRGDLEGK